MKITREPLGENLERFEVCIVRSDWYGEYDKQLRAARRDMSMPGFRKGQAPLGLVAKRLGGEEFMFRFVNEAQSRELGKFVEEQGITVAYPFVPSDAEVPTPDFRGDATVTIRYDVVVAPRYELPEELSWAPVEVEATDAQWAACEKELLENNKTSQSVADVCEGAMIWLKRELAAGEASEEPKGIEFQILFDSLSEDGKNQFKGRKEGDTVEVLEGTQDYDAILGALQRELRMHGQHSEAREGEDARGTLLVKLIKVTKYLPAEMGWDFYENYFALRLLSQLPGQTAEEKTEDAAEVRERFRRRYLEQVQENARVSNGLAAFESALEGWEWRVPEEHLKKMQQQERATSLPSEYAMEQIKREAFTDQLLRLIGKETLESEEYKQLGERCIDLSCYDELERNAIGSMYGMLHGSVPISRYFMQTFLPQKMEEERFQSRIRETFTRASLGHYLLGRVGAKPRKLGVEQLTFKGGVKSEVEEQARKLKEKWGRWREAMQAALQNEAAAEEQPKEEKVKK